MVENEIFLQNDKLIANIFNNYFCKIAKYLSIQKDLCFSEQSSNTCAERVKHSIEKYKDHPSTDCIKDKILNKTNPRFSFNFNLSLI